MSITRLPREQGIAIHCDFEGCKESKFTGNILAKVNRAAASVEGWGRGLRKATKTFAGTKRSDFCPPHMLIERELAAKEKAASDERKRQRDEARKARFAAKPPKKPRRKKSDATPASAPSPSADSAPPPAS